MNQPLSLADVTIVINFTVIVIEVVLEKLSGKGKDRENFVRRTIILLCGDFFEIFLKKLLTLITVLVLSYWILVPVFDSRPGETFV